MQPQRGEDEENEGDSTDDGNFRALRRTLLQRTFTFEGDDAHAGDDATQQKPTSIFPDVAESNNEGGLKRVRNRRLTMYPTASRQRIPTLEANEHDDDLSVDSQLERMWEEDDTIFSTSQSSNPDFNLIDGTGYSGFHHLCNLPRNGPDDERWESVRTYLAECFLFDPDRAASELMVTQREGSDYLPIHVVCALDPPKDVVESMIRINPQCLLHYTKLNKSTLLLASGGLHPASFEVISLLVRECPGDKEVADYRNKTPLHEYLVSCEFLGYVPQTKVVKLLSTPLAKKTIDIKGRSPFTYLGRAARRLPTHMLKDHLKELQMCMDATLFICPRHTSLFIKDLRNLPFELRIHAFHYRSVKIFLNESMQNATCTAILMLDIYVQISLVAMFTADIFKQKKEKSVSIEWAIILGCTYWSFRWIFSFVSSTSKLRWLASPWRLSLLVQIIMLGSLTQIAVDSGGVLVTMNDFKYGCDKYTQNVLLVTTLFLWLQVLSIMKSAFKDFSVFVGATIKIMSLLVPFLVATFVILAMFATMFYISALGTSNELGTNNCNNLDQDGAHASFCSFQDAMIWVYSLSIGGLETSHFYSDSPILGRILLIAFSFIVIILLLNIIIAIVTDGYQVVNAEAEGEFWKNRFEFLYEVDGMNNFFKGHLNHNMSKESILERNKKEKIYQKLRYSGRAKTFADLLMLLRNGVILFVWFIAGMATLGILWPNSMRRYIFCPTILSEEDEKKAKDEMRALEKLEEELQEIRIEHLKSIEELKKDNGELKKDNRELKMNLASMQSTMNQIFSKLNEK